MQSALSEYVGEEEREKFRRVSGIENSWVDKSDKVFNLLCAGLVILEWIKALVWNITFCRMNICLFILYYLCEIQSFLVIQSFKYCDTQSYRKHSCLTSKTLDINCLQLALDLCWAFNGLLWWLGLAKFVIRNGAILGFETQWGINIPRAIGRYMST